MLLTSLGAYELEDAVLESNAKVLRNVVICDGYGRTYDMKYSNWHRDPKPLVLVIGYYTHPSTGNRLMCGVNLNTLQGDQIEDLRKALPQILRSGKDTKTRYWAGRKLLPTVFKGAYRTYNTDYVDKVSPGTLRFWNPKADFRKERERMLQLEKEKLLKKKKLKDAKLKKRAAEKPRDIPYDEPEDLLAPKKPKEIPYKDDKLLGKKRAKKRAKVKKIKKVKALKRRARRLAKTAQANRRARSIPYESYIDTHDAIICSGCDIAVYNILTNKLIADDCDAVNIITNAGWDNDECVVFERANDWAAEHCYEGVGRIERVIAEVEHKVKIVMG